MRVLIATDGSDDAVAAAAAGLGLLAPPDDILVVCVVDTPHVATRGMESGFSGGMATDEEVDAAWRVAEDAAEAAVRRTEEALPGGVSVDHVIVAGDAGPAICRVAGERDVDAIVLGSRGLGAVRRALLGSVSTHVTANAPCPVVVVRSGTD